MNNNLDPLNLANPSFIVTKLSMDDFYIMLAALQIVHFSCYKISDESICVEFVRAVDHVYTLLKKHFNYER